MTVLKAILGILYIMICVAAMVVIMMQESKSDGLSSSISGAGTSFFSKSGGLKKETLLARLTIVLSVFFAIIAIVLSSLMRLGA